MAMDTHQASRGEYTVLIRYPRNPLAGTTPFGSIEIQGPIQRFYPVGTGNEAHLVSSIAQKILNSTYALDFLPASFPNTLSLIEFSEQVDVAVWTFRGNETALVRLARILGHSNIR